MMLNISESLLNILHSLFIPRILTHIIAQLDRCPTRRRRDFDHDVERFGFLAVRFVREVILIY